MVQIIQVGISEVINLVKITVEVTNKELNALENLTISWNLCKKHKSIINASEEEYFKFTQNCKKCAEINKEIRNKTLHLWSKMVTAYLKSTKKKM